MKFEILWCDTLIARAEWDSEYKLYRITSFDRTPGRNPFLGGDMTSLQMDDFIKERCFEECNGNAKMFLEDMGLSAYNPWEIVKITHGVMLEDFVWIRFDGEDLKWNDVKHVRG
jgi:hypothetical protein